MANGLDTGTASAAGGANQEMATVGRIDGSKTLQGKAKTTRTPSRKSARGLLRELARLLKQLE